MILLLIGCSLFDSYAHDNAVEEIIEEVVKQQTGLDIDLTPTSIEK